MLSPQHQQGQLPHCQLPPACTADCIALYRGRPASAACALTSPQAWGRRCRHMDQPRPQGRAGAGCRPAVAAAALAPLDATPPPCHPPVTTLCRADWGPLAHPPAMQLGQHPPLQATIHDSVVHKARCTVHGPGQLIASRHVCHGKGREKSTAASKHSLRTGYTQTRVVSPYPITCHAPHPLGVLAQTAHTPRTHQHSSACYQLVPQSHNAPNCCAQQHSPHTAQAAMRVPAPFLQTTTCWHKPRKGHRGGCARGS